jgi:hypothetical protein
VNSATVVAASAWAAEVLAKAVLLRGAPAPFDILGGTGAEGMAVVDDGRVLATPGLGQYLGGVALARGVTPMPDGACPAGRQ